METINLIRFILGAVFISAGIGMFLFGIAGVFRLKYTLNRMHFAGSGDTAALAFTIIGVSIINGIDYSTLKLFLVLFFFWFASPVSSHLIGRLMINIDEELETHCKVLNKEESEKLISGK